MHGRRPACAPLTHNDKQRRAPTEMANWRTTPLHANCLSSVVQLWAVARSRVRLVRSLRSGARCLRCLGDLFREALGTIRLGTRPARATGRCAHSLQQSTTISSTTISNDVFYVSKTPVACTRVTPTHMSYDKTKNNKPSGSASVRFRSAVRDRTLVAGHELDPVRQTAYRCTILGHRRCALRDEARRTPGRRDATGCPQSPPRATRITIHGCRPSAHA